MQTNLDVLDQYRLSLQGTSSKLIEKSLGASDFPAAEVAVGACINSTAKVRNISLAAYIVVIDDSRAIYFIYIERMAFQLSMEITNVIF